MGDERSARIRPHHGSLGGAAARRVAGCIRSFGPAAINERPHRACLDGEEDNSRGTSGADLIHHPGKPDGALSSFLRTVIAHHLVHQSAQGGWGPNKSTTSKATRPSSCRA